MDEKKISEIFLAAKESNHGAQVVKLLTEKGIDMGQIEVQAQENPSEAMRIFWAWQNQQAVDARVDLKAFNSLADVAPAFTEIVFHSYCDGQSVEDQGRLVSEAFLGKNHHSLRQPMMKVFSAVEIGEPYFLKIARAAFTMASPQDLLNKTYPFVSIQSRNLESRRSTLISHASLFASLDYAASFWGFIYALFADELVSQEQLSHVELAVGKTSWDVETEAKGWMYAIIRTENRVSVFESVANLLKQNEYIPNYPIAFYETMVVALKCFLHEKETISSILEWLLFNFQIDLARPHRRTLVDCFESILENQAALQLPPSTVMKMDSLLMLLVQEQIEDLEFWFPVDAYLQARLPLDEETGYFVLRNVIQLADIHQSSFLFGIEPYRALEIVQQPAFGAQFQSLVESSKVEDILYLFTLCSRILKKAPILPVKITSERHFLRLLMAYRWRSWSMDADSARLFMEFLVINSAIKVPNLQDILVNEIFRTILSFKPACFDRWLNMDWEQPVMQVALNRAKKYFEQRIDLVGSEALNFGFPGMDELAGVHEAQFRSKVLNYSGGMNSILNVFSQVDVIYGNSFSGMEDQSKPAKMNPVSHEFPLNRFLMTKPEASDIISKNAFKRLGMNHE